MLSDDVGAHSSKEKPSTMCTLILSLVILGTVAAAPVRAAPALQPAATALATFDQGVIQPAQYNYNRREARRREEIRRRREYRRRQAIRRGY